MSSAEDRIAKLEAQVARLLEALAERDAEIARLRTRVDELEGQLGQNSTNSHKPPSTDPPGARPEKRPTGRQRGAQPGHKGHKRVLLPPEKVTRRSAVRPSVCACCGGERVKASSLEPRVHQVIDVPEIQPDVHEVTMHAVLCRDCGVTTWGALPPDVPAHMFGPRLLALIGYLVGSRMSRRQLRELLAEVFGIPVSLGALSEAEARTSDALASPFEEAATHVRGHPVKHVDASTWRSAGAYAALWTIATKLVAVFFVVGDARAATIRALLGTLQGIMVSDRGSQFGFWAMDRRQVCWAHLLRKYVAFSERKDSGAEIGHALILLSQAMLSEWHRVRDGTLSRDDYQRMVPHAQRAIEIHLERGAALGIRGLSGACADILAHRAALFTFAYDPAVDPTNNLAERMLRPFVQWRKSSYGSQSERGCVFAQRIMTAMQSLRLQKRSVFQFLCDACRAASAGASSPSLLPAAP